MGRSFGRDSVDERQRPAQARYKAVKLVTDDCTLVIPERSDLLVFE